MGQRDPLRSMIRPNRGAAAAPTSSITVMPPNTASGAMPRSRVSGPTMTAGSQKVVPQPIICVTARGAASGRRRTLSAGEGSASVMEGGDALRPAVAKRGRD